MPNLIEHRKSLHRQITDKQKQHQDMQEQMLKLQPLANLGMAWAMTAHELNNLLTPIANYAQLAMQHPDDAALSAKALEKAQRLSTQAAAVLEKVMILANSSSDQKTQCNLSELLEDVFTGLGRDFSKDQIKLIRDIDPALSVWSDACELRQVIFNLILNARHSMQDGGGTLRISATEDTETTRIEIEDTGCGIAPEKLKHIFTPFYTDGKKNGNGLGLAYCQKVIESHGGCISAESELGRGTRFRIVLPKHVGSI